VTALPAPHVTVAGATFAQGDDHHYPEEAPSRLVTVASFRIDVHAVTNRQFAAFTDAAGYITDAERVGSAAVFVAPAGAVDLAQPDLWWRQLAGATWRQPRGAPLTTEHDDHPVVQVSRNDAEAFAAWAGRRLPTEAEWELAANAGRALPPEWPLASDGMLLANV